MCVWTRVKKLQNYNRYCVHYSCHCRLLIDCSCINVVCAVFSYSLNLWYNKSLVPEWPTFTDVYSFTVSYNWWPRRFWYYRQPSVIPVHHTSVVPIWTNISRRSGPPVVSFRFSCLLCCCRSSTPATVSPFRRELILVFVCLLRKFDRFWRL